MPPIRIHTGSPINANDEDDTTPNVGAANASTVQPNTTIPTPTTSTPSTYPAAQPGQSVPAPTGRPAPRQAAPTRTIAASPSSSAASSTSSDPYPAQPGAVPTPSYPITTDSPKISVPPPPKAGEAVQPAAYYAPHHASPTASSTQAGNPPSPLSSYQQSGTIDSPYRAQPPASTTWTTGNRGAPGSDPGGLNGPPGYVQDSYSAFHDRRNEPFNPFAAVSHTVPNNPDTDGILGGSNNKNNTEGGDGSYSEALTEAKEGLSSAWEAASSWLSSAGSKLAEAEADIWKAINKNNK